MLEELNKIQDIIDAYYNGLLSYDEYLLRLEDTHELTSPVQR